MTIHNSFFLRNETFILRDLCANDYYNNYLDLLGQLSKIDKDQIHFSEFCNFVNDLQERNKVFIIENKTTEKIVACATILIENKIIHNMGKVCHVEDVVVDNSVRGTGIGKILMDFVKTYSNQLGCYKIILDCSEYNVGFYEKCGFKVNGAQMALYHSSL